MNVLEAAKLFKLATVSPNKGDKITVEVVDVDEDDGVRKYTLKFDNTFCNETRTLFFFEKSEV